VLAGEQLTKAVRPVHTAHDSYYTYGPDVRVIFTGL